MAVALVARVVLTIIGGVVEAAIADIAKASGLLLPLLLSLFIFLRESLVELDPMDRHFFANSRVNGILHVPRHVFERLIVIDGQEVAFLRLERPDFVHVGVTDVRFGLPLTAAAHPAVVILVPTVPTENSAVVVPRLFNGALVRRSVRSVRSVRSRMVRSEGAVLGRTVNTGVTLARRTRLV